MVNPLTSLGIQTGALSSQLQPGTAEDSQPRSGGLSEILQSTNLLRGYEQQAAELRAARQQLQQTETPGTFESLLQPRSILGLLLAGGAAAFGGAEGRQAALGIGLGMLNKGDLLAAQAQEAKQEAVKNYLDQEEKLLDRAQTIRSGNRDILRTFPEMFDHLPPEIVTYLTTGTGEMQIQSTARRAAVERGRNFEAVARGIMKSFEQAKTPEGRELAYRALFKHAKATSFLDKHPEVLEAARSGAENLLELANAKLMAEYPWAVDAYAQTLLANGETPDQTNWARDIRFWYFVEDLRPEESLSKPSPDQAAWDSMFADFTRWINSSKENFDKYELWYRSAVGNGMDPGKAQGAAMRKWIEQTGEQNRRHIGTLTKQIELRGAYLGPEWLLTQARNVVTKTNELGAIFVQLENDPALKQQFQRQMLFETEQTGATAVQGRAREMYQATIQLAYSVFTESPPMGFGLSMHEAADKVDALINDAKQVAGDDIVRQQLYIERALEKLVDKELVVD